MSLTNYSARHASLWPMPVWVLLFPAMRQHKPIIIFPRIAAWGEHRNEHQLATAQKMKELGYVYVATDAKELKELLTTRNLRPLHDLGDIASKSLIDELCKVIG